MATESFTFTKDDGIDAGLADRFEWFVRSHADESRHGLGLPDSGHADIRVTHRDGELKLERDGDNVKIDIPEAVALKAIAIADGFHTANGIVVLPTFIAMLKSDTVAHELDGDGNPKKVAVLDLLADRAADDSQKTLGTLMGAVRQVALAGWLETDGLDENTTLWLNEAGRAAAKVVRENQATFDKVYASQKNSQRYNELARRDDPADADAINEFEALVKLSGEDNIKIDDTSPNTRRAVRHLLDFADSMLLGPTLVALAMAEHQKVDDRIAEVSPGVFDMFDDDLRLDLEKLDPKKLNRRYLDAAFDLLARVGVVTRDDANRNLVQMTTWGKAYSEVAPAACSLPGSYIKMYAVMDELLWKDADPFNIGEDTHVDRVMNIWGSSRAGSGPASAVIADKILRKFFDETPLDEQPAGIADMGCGDGTSLSRLATFIIENTERGKHLDSHPLVVIGADYNDSSQSRTRQTLTAYDDVKGVDARVVFADVTQPDQYNETVKGLGINVKDKATGEDRPLELRDLVHTFMFLVHNRILSVKARDEAKTVIADAVASADRDAVAKAISDANGEQVSLPQDNDALTDLVIGQFRTSFSDKGPLVPGVVAGADFIQFMKRWAPHSSSGFVSLESHNPWGYKMVEQAPDDNAAWMRCEQLPHAFNWGMHFQSAQYLLPFEEYSLAMALSGFAPMGGQIHGGIHPEGLPSVDRTVEYRFFSIGCYQSH